MKVAYVRACVRARGFIAALIYPPRSPSITRLCLAHNALGDAGAAALAAALLLPTHPAAAAAALLLSTRPAAAAAAGGGLRHLDLSANRIGPRGAEVRLVTVLSCAVQVGLVLRDCGV